MLVYKRQSQTKDNEKARINSLLMSRALYTSINRRTIGNASHKQKLGGKICGHINVHASYRFIINASFKKYMLHA